MIADLLFSMSCSFYPEKPLTHAETPGAENSAAGEDFSSSVEMSPEDINNTIQNTDDDYDFAGSGFLMLENNRFETADAFPGIQFNHPLDLQNAGDGSGRIFIAEQNGKIFVINPEDKSSPELFLDISSKVNDNGSEQGLLGLAFHPDFKENGQFFVNYTTEKSTIVSRFELDADNPVQADPESEAVMIEFSQPYANHNGGGLAFGPSDGYLYIGTGDGGGAGDPQKNAQNLGSLLGKILRIDINSVSQDRSYVIPEENPFKDNTEGYKEEVYAYGLRNPWRFSFDAIKGDLWVADVGQNKVEEINIVRKGGNYGWNIMEGSYCYDPPSDCNAEGLINPVYEYEHPMGRSITGGYVYRGKDVPVLEGIYIYADFITGYIWGLSYYEGRIAGNIILAETEYNISSFGIDENKEIYFTSFDGKIYKLILKQA